MARDFHGYFFRKAVARRKRLIEQRVEQAAGVFAVV
jgi:hypothetical protein